jgi:mono/diheme cytochrome c family protein
MYNAPVSHQQKGSSMKMNVRSILGGLVAGLTIAQGAQAAPPAAPAREAAEKRVERGRYLVKIAGCNACHTAGYRDAAGKIPEAQWLTGDALGWRGAWGTTYPANLRLHAGRFGAKEWVAEVQKLQTRPPMPWFSLRAMRKNDLAAIYQYVKQLGAPGTAAPAFVPAGTEPKTPFVQFPLPPKK